MTGGYITNFKDTQTSENQFHKQLYWKQQQQHWRNIYWGVPFLQNEHDSSRFDGHDSSIGGGKSLNIAVIKTHKNG